MTAAEYVHGLRDLADWIERHPEIEPKLSQHSSRILVPCLDQEDFVEKLPILEGLGVVSRDKWVNVNRQFGPITVQVYIDPNKIGEVTVSTKQVEVTDWEPHPEVATILGAFETEEVPA